MSNGIQGAPQTRQAWLDMTHGNREVRGRVDGEGGLEVYGSKRGFLGQMLSFIKDPMHATEREAKRSMATSAFREFVSETSGLNRDQIQQIFTQAGIVPGQPLRRDAMERVFAAIDRAVQVGQAPPPPEPPKSVDKGTVSLEHMPGLIQKELVDNNGVATPRMIEWLVRSGVLDLPIDRDDPTLKVTQVTRDGANTLATFNVEVQGKSVFFVKEPGGPYVEEGGKRIPFGYRSTPEGLVPTGDYFEDRHMKVIDESPLGQMGTLETRSGNKLDLAPTGAVCRYVAEGQVGVDANEPAPGDVVHQLSFLHSVRGTQVDGIMKNGTLQEKIDVARKLGDTLGAFHALWKTGDEMPTGGLRTLVHGDFHPGNIFIEEETNTVHLIDLAGAAKNFDHDPPGFDMLRDVKRTLAQGGLYVAAKQDPEIRQAFLESYCANFDDIRLPDGSPKYTPESISQLILNPNLSHEPL